MMDKAVPSTRPRGSVEQQPSDELSLEQARAIVGSMTFFSDKQVIAACSAIEVNGGASEKFDFRALRLVLQRKSD